MVRQTSELETNVVAVERIKEYIETPNEARSYSDMESDLTRIIITSLFFRPQLLLTTAVLSVVGQRGVM